MYILKPGVTRFGGASGDIRPTSGTVIEDHCTIYHAALNQSVDHTLVRSRVCSLLAGLGPVYHNGQLLPKDQAVELNHLDRVMIGRDMLLFRDPEAEAALTTPQDEVNDDETGV